MKWIETHDTSHLVRIADIQGGFWIAGDAEVFPAGDVITTEDRAAIAEAVSVIDGLDEVIEKLSEDPSPGSFDVSVMESDAKTYRKQLNDDQFARLRAIGGVA